jgi:hypothetical protein
VLVLDKCVGLEGTGKYDIAYEVDHYEVTLENGSIHIFGTEESAVKFCFDNRSGNPKLNKILYGILI